MAARSSATLCSPATLGANIRYTLMQCFEIIAKPLACLRTVWETPDAHGTKSGLTGIG
jgi:hypothetical protein